MKFKEIIKENSFYQGQVSVPNPHYYCDNCGKDLWDKRKRMKNSDKSPDINITKDGKRLCNKCFNKVKLN